MSRPGRPHPGRDAHGSPGADAVSRVGNVWIGGAVAWVLFYFVWFFSFELPNSNPKVHRLDVLEAVPVLLLNSVDRPLPDSSSPNFDAAMESWRRSGWKYFPQRLGLMGIAAAIVAGGWGMGHLVLRGVRVPLPARCLERMVLACGVGLSAVSLITLGCGLAGLLSRALLGSLLAAAALSESFLRLRARRTSVNSGQRNVTWRQVVPILVATPFMLCLLLGAFLPDTDFDVREYHFEGPKEWFLAGRISFLPHNVYTSFPFLTEMFTLLGMVLHGDWYWGAVAGKGVLMCFAPLTALGLFTAGRRWFSPAAGTFAALIHISTPWIYRISIIAYAEGGLTFYLFAALLAVGLGIEQLIGIGTTGALKHHSDQTPKAEDLTRNLGANSPLTPGPSPAGGRGEKQLAQVASVVPRWLLLKATGFPGVLRLIFVAGLLAGSAVGCKYPGLVSVVIPLTAAVFAAPLLLRPIGVPPLRAAGQFAGVFALAVVITFGPWLVKNALETGNPVYPLLYTVFGGRDWDAELNAKWKRGHSPDNYQLAKLVQYFVDVTAKADWQSPLLFGFAPLAWLAFRGRSVARWLWLYVAYLFLTWWGLTHRVDRFWVPLIPVVALLAGAGAIWSRSFLWRSFAYGSFVFVALFNLAFITTGLCGYNAYLSDLALARASMAKPDLAYLNQQLPAGAKVLFVGEAEVFEAEFPLVYNTVFDRSIFHEWCAEPEPGVPAAELKLRDPEAIRRTLAEAGITHVCVNWQEVLRYRIPSSYGYTDFVSPRRFAELRKLKILGDPWPIPAYRPFNETNPSNTEKEEQQEVKRWGPELIQHRLRQHAEGERAASTAETEKVYITFEVYPVLPEPR